MWQARHRRNRPRRRTSHPSTARAVMGSSSRARSASRCTSRRRRDVHRDAERARDDDPMTALAVLGWLVRRRGRFLRCRACHITDAMCTTGRSGRCETGAGGSGVAEIPPNVGALPYGGAVDESAAVVDTLPARGQGPALSPSRAADFMTCPLLYRFRVIDRLPEPPTAATARGTLVHAALERLFDLPAAERTPAAARALLTQEWDRLAAEEPDLAALFDNEAERSGWLASATAIVDAYFTLEVPRRLEPAEREAYVETTLESGLRLRGYIDRLDVAPSGDIRIVDYKTGRAPREAYEASALFQMKFYALRSEERRV